MSRKFRVGINTSAYATVDVEIDDDAIREVAELNEVDVDGVTVEMLRDKIEENYETPNLCAQCSGWGRDYSLDLGDEWEVDEGENAIREVKKGE